MDYDWDYAWTINPVSSGTPATVLNNAPSGGPPTAVVFFPREIGHDYNVQVSASNSSTIEYADTLTSASASNAFRSLFLQVSSFNGGTSSFGNHSVDSGVYFSGATATLQLECHPGQIHDTQSAAEAANLTWIRLHEDAAVADVDPIATPISPGSDPLAELFTWSRWPLNYRSYTAGGVASGFGIKWLVLKHQDSALEFVRIEQVATTLFDATDCAYNPGHTTNQMSANWYYWKLSTGLTGWPTDLYYARDPVVPSPEAVAYEYVNHPGTGITLYDGSPQKWRPRLWKGAGRWAFIHAGNIGHDHPLMGTGGLCLFALICRHEARHADDNQTSNFFPTGYNATFDSDDDDLRDSFEVLQNAPGETSKYIVGDPQSFPDKWDYGYDANAHNHTSDQYNDDEHYTLSLQNWFDWRTNGIETIPLDWSELGANAYWAGSVLQYW